MHDGIGTPHPPRQGDPPGQAPTRAGTPHMVNERAVRILLECILVFLYFGSQETIALKKTHSGKYCRKHPATGVHVVTTFPSNQSLYQNLVTFGCQVDYWKPRYNEDDSSWQFDLKDLQTLFKVHSIFKICFRAIENLP